MWLSDGHTLGKLHFDPFDNLLCQVSTCYLSAWHGSHGAVFVKLDGAKTLTLFEPWDNSRLYESHIPEAQFEWDSAAGQLLRRHLLDSTSMVMSPVDIKQPDLEVFAR